MDLSTLHLNEEEFAEAQRRLLIIERVMTAPDRGNVVIEVSKDVFEAMAAQANPDMKVTVVWRTDATGFSTPSVFAVARETLPIRPKRTRKKAIDAS